MHPTLVQEVLFVGSYVLMEIHYIIKVEVQPLKDLGCHYKAPRSGWLQQQKFYFLPVLEAGSWRPRGQQGWLLLPLFPASPHFLPSVCDCVLMPSSVRVLGKVHPRDLI